MFVKFLQVIMIIITFFAIGYLIYTGVHYQEKNSFWDGAIWGMGLTGVLFYLRDRLLQKISQGKQSL